jgi:hypothetical protein
VNFFPAKFFSGILEKENLSEQKKILAGKKFTEQKSFLAEQKRLFELSPIPILLFKHFRKREGVRKFQLEKQSYLLIFDPRKKNPLKF